MHFQHGSPGTTAPTRPRDNPEPLGVVIGPLANRIGDAAFELDGTRHAVKDHEGQNP